MKGKKISKELWKWARVSFWFMIIFWVLNAIVENFYLEYYESILFWIIGAVWITTILGTFITSIIHLTKFKKKGFAITALVFSSYLILTFLIGIIMGMTQASDTSDELLNVCEGMCWNIEGTEYIEIDPQQGLENEIMCNCLDNSNNILEQFSIPIK